MNYLAHLHLGGLQPAQLLGSLYGDFVKGRLAGATDYMTKPFREAALADVVEKYIAARTP